jgi:2-phospho-L-lactate guanylyltransferase
VRLADCWAVVPLKRVDQGKERLAETLDADARRALIAAMAEDVLAALLAVPFEPAHILLVSEDPQVARLAERLDVGIFAPRAASNDPLNAALREASAEVWQRGGRHILIMHADLPLADARELRALLEVHRAVLADGVATAVTMVTDRAGEGTNCLLATPPQAVDLRFGASSREHHRAACTEAGIRCTEFASAALGCDIDHPQDLAALERCCQSPDNACGVRTRALLAGTAWAAGFDGNSSRT